MRAFEGALGIDAWLVKPPSAANTFDDAVNVYLSPHHDDVCFSLGGLTSRKRGGWLVNLFTRSNYSVRLPPHTAGDTETITAMRTREDIAFADACALTRIDLGLSDAPLRGRRPMDLSGVEDDLAVLRRPLLDCLSQISQNSAQSGRLVLFCPAGIGGHANHVATTRAIVEAYDYLERWFRILFYEDLHYAADGIKRRDGLLRLFTLMNGRRATRITIELGSRVPAKLALIHLFRSQLAEMPATCRRYSPSVPYAGMGLHEAMWEFEPLAGRS